MCRERDVGYIEGFPTCRERDVGHIEGFPTCRERDVGHIEGIPRCRERDVGHIGGHSHVQGARSSSPASDADEDVRAPGVQRYAVPRLYTITKTHWTLRKDTLFPQKGYSHP